MVGFGLGLSLAAPPGPVNAVIAEESTFRGWRAGVVSGLGAMAADGLFFLLTVAGLLSVVETNPSMRGGLALFGGVLMLYIGYSVYREAGSGFERGGGDGHGFRRTFVVAVGNPYQLGWWLTAGVSFFEAGGPGIVFGLFLGIFVWVTVFPALIVEGEERVELLGPVVAYGSAAVLAGFGSYLLVDAASSLLF